MMMTAEERTLLSAQNCLTDMYSPHLNSYLVVSIRLAISNKGASKRSRGFSSGFSAQPPRLISSAACGIGAGGGSG